MRPALLAAIAAGLAVALAVAVGSSASFRRPAHALGAAPLAGGAAATAHAVAAVASMHAGGASTEAVRRSRPGDRLEAPVPSGPAAGGQARAAATDGELDAGQRVALRQAGWAVPGDLAGTWRLRRARVLTSREGDAGMLQLVYTRGGRTLSVFQRAAPLAWSSLPEGHQAVSELPGSVREWPGAEPSRLVWESDGRTFVLVGDAERPALLQAAASLPAAEAESMWRRLRRGLDQLLARLAM